MQTAPLVHIFCMFHKYLDVVYRKFTRILDVFLYESQVWFQVSQRKELWYIFTW